MNTPGQLSRRQRLAAFTLIELLVVIAIIGILAAMILTVSSAANRNKQIKLAQAQLQAMETAIDGYKTKLGFYPPDNTNTPWVNPLYFELSGTTNNGAGNPAPTMWGTLDGSAQIGTTTSPYNVFNLFSVAGFANTSTRAHSDDQGAAASVFISGLTPNQFGAYNPAVPNVKILVCPVQWPGDRAPMITNNPALNPWCYLSTHPTNNTGSYDLWVDLIIRGKTNRICNWSPNPILL